jgi:hypothetical protein
LHAAVLAIASTLSVRPSEAPARIDGDALVGMRRRRDRSLLGLLAEGCGAPVRSVSGFAVVRIRGQPRAERSGIADSDARSG